MAGLYRSRAIETIQAGFTGTGTYNLGGAGTNAQALDAAFGSGGRVRYIVRTADWSKFEEGHGIVTSGSPDTLTRNVDRSYNGSVYGTAAVSWLSGDHPLYVYSVPDGTSLSGLANHHRGTSTPGWAEAGFIWEDTTGAPTGVLLKIYDGTDWITLGTVNETANTFTPSLTILTTRGDLLTRDASTAVRLAVGANDRLLKSDGTDPAWGQLTNGMVPANTVGIDKLANQSQKTILGRADAAGTGAVTALSAAQATVIIDAMVGDSGSGGTKGSVPAPASGDAAAGKFLSAAGTWLTAGGISKFDSETPSGAASSTLTGINASSRGVIIIGKIFPATNAVTISIVFRDAGGDITARTFGYLKYDGSSTPAAATNANAAIALGTTVSNDATSGGVSFMVILPYIKGAIERHGFFLSNQGVNTFGKVGFFNITDTDAITEIKIEASSGNISGQIDGFEWV